MNSSTRAAQPAPNLVRWGAVFSGTIIALAGFAMLSLLWVALAANRDGGGLFADNLRYWVGGTAIGALFVAGLLAGYLSGTRGATSGVLNGMTAWGLLVIVSAVTVLPGLTALAGSLTLSSGTVTSADNVWTAFWALLIGLGAAGLGGLFGGLARRQVKIAAADVRQYGEERDVYPAEPLAGVQVDRGPVVYRAPTGLAGEGSTATTGPATSTARHADTEVIDRR